MRLELVGVGKRFGKVEALAGVDLDLPSGAKVALIGPNGSGKTTLIRALLGLVRHRGQIRIDGAPAGRRALAPRIAYVPQIAPQLAAPVGDVVRLVARVRGVAPAEIAAIAARLDLDVDAIAARPLRALSGGSRQKLLLALALAARPALLVLDEPTASLDAEARGRFLGLCGELARDATVVLCSHRLEELRSLVDHVVALADGRVVYHGAAADYLARRVGAVLEVRVTGEPPGWLADHGFVAGAAGWWGRPVDRAQKLALVPAAVAALGGALADLAVRDVDLVELGEVRHA